jgi:hypothetical protein
LGDCAQYAQADGSSITLPYVAPIMAAARLHKVWLERRLQSTLNQRQSW